MIRMTKFPKTSTYSGDSIRQQPSNVSTRLRRRPVNVSTSRSWLSSRTAPESAPEVPT